MHARGVAARHFAGAQRLGVRRARRRASAPPPWVERTNEGAGLGKGIPDKFTLTLAGGADLDLDNIRIKEIPPISSAITSIAPLELKPVSLAITQLPTISLDLAVKELPKIDMDIGLKPTRVTMPMNTHVCLKVFGLKLLDLSLCGENMVILEPYTPRRAELGCN